MLEDPATCAPTECTTFVLRATGDLRGYGGIYDRTADDLFDRDDLMELGRYVVHLGVQYEL